MNKAKVSALQGCFDPSPFLKVYSNSKKNFFFEDSFFNVISTSNVELEHTTPRSRLTRSTNWTSQVPLKFQVSKSSLYFLTQDYSYPLGTLDQPPSTIIGFPVIPLSFCSRVKRATYFILLSLRHDLKAALRRAYIT